MLRKLPINNAPRPRRRRAGSALGASVLASALALGLSACGGSDPPAQPLSDDATMAELYGAAKDEGEVVIYGPTQDQYTGVYEKFEEEYPGVTVTEVDIFGAELDSRLDAEISAGGPEVDLIQDGVANAARRAKEGLFAAYVPATPADIPAELIGQDEQWIVGSRSLYGPIYNTEKVAEDEVPATWADLTKPEWSGRMGTSDPTESGGTSQSMAAAFDAGAIDEEWLKDLRDQVSPRTYPSVAAVVQAVLAGEVDLGLVASHAAVVQQQNNGAPIAFAALEDGSFMLEFGIGVVDGSPHPNAGRLLESWLLSEAGQAAIAEVTYEFGSMPNAPLPPGADALGPINPLPYPGVEREQKIIELIAEAFK
jgi:iron(III) transport system substrate-binding protein